jgi:uncharacterized protein (TIGR03437 family)
LPIKGTDLVESCALPRQITIGGQPAEIVATNHPENGDPDQMTVRVPSAIPPGPAVRVTLTCAGRPTNDLTILVRDTPY